VIFALSLNELLMRIVLIVPSLNSRIDLFVEKEELPCIRSINHLRKTLLRKRVMVLVGSTSVLQQKVRKMKVKEPNRLPLFNLPLISIVILVIFVPTRTQRNFVPLVPQETVCNIIKTIMEVFCSNVFYSGLSTFQSLRSLLLHEERSILLIIILKTLLTIHRFKIIINNSNGHKNITFF
jgi:hypothetical protein